MEHFIIEVYTVRWEDFFGTELACSYDMHFLKADGMWITIVRLKRWIVESFKKLTAVYYTKTLKIF